MSDEQYGAEVVWLRVEGTGSRPCPPSQTGGKSSSPGELCSDIYQALPMSAHGAWLTSHDS